MLVKNHEAQVKILFFSTYYFSAKVVKILNYTSVYLSTRGTWTFFTKKVGA